MIKAQILQVSLGAITLNLYVKQRTVYIIFILIVADGAAAYTLTIGNALLAISGSGAGSIRQKDLLRTTSIRYAVYSLQRQLQHS